MWLFKGKKVMSLNRKPNKEECQAMQRVCDKIRNAGLTFDLLACVQIAKIFAHYEVEGFKTEEKETILAD